MLVTHFRLGCIYTMVTLLTQFVPQENVRWSSLVVQGIMLAGMIYIKERNMRNFITIGDKDRRESKQCRDTFNKMHDAIILINKKTDLNKKPIVAMANKAAKALFKVRREAANHLAGVEDDSGTENGEDRP